MNGNQANGERNIQATIGAILAIFGISAVGLLKIVLNQNSNLLSVGVSVLSVGLMLNITRYYRAITADMLCILGFYLLTLFYALISNRGFSDAHGMLYQLFYFVQIVVLWNVKKLNPTTFVKYAYGLLLLANLLGIYLVYSEVLSSGRVGFSTLGDNEMVTRATVGNLALLLCAACVVYRPRSSLGKCLYAVAWFLAVANLLLASRRTAIIEAIVIVAVYLHKYRPKKVDASAIGKIVLIVLGAFFAVMILYRINGTVQAVVKRSTQMLIDGVNTFLGRDRSDVAAGYRRTVWATKPRELLEDSSVAQLLVGRGFMKGWFDVPYLQAFWDMGLFGGMLFLYIQLILPIKYVMRKYENPMIIFAQCCVISRLIDNIASGVCYGTCSFLVMLMVFISQDQESGIITAKPQNKPTY